MTSEELYDFLKEHGLEKSTLVMNTTGAIERIKVVSNYNVVYDIKGQIKIEKSLTSVELSSG